MKARHLFSLCSALICCVNVAHASELEACLGHPKISKRLCRSLAEAGQPRSALLILDKENFAEAVGAVERLKGDAFAFEETLARVEAAGFKYLAEPISLSEALALASEPSVLVILENSPTHAPRARQTRETR